MEKISCIFVYITFLIITIEAQLLLPQGQKWVERSSYCGSGSRCVLPRYCHLVRNQRNWYRNAKSCPIDGSRRRRYCCPFEANRVEPIQAEPLPLSTNVGNSGSTSGCGQSKTDEFRSPYIMGGEDATKGMFPWMAALTKKNRRGEDELECTAFLIDSRHVLTAAHCFISQDTTRYGIRLGDVDWRLARHYDINNIVIHPGYRRGFYYDDIAVLTLAEVVTDPNVGPICLPDQRTRAMNLVGVGTTVAGWGSERYGGQMSNTLKQLSSVPVLSNSDCNRRLQSQLAGFRRQFSRGISTSLICAGFLEGGRDSCGGDSGGPLMIQEDGLWIAVGIVSFGYECGKAGYPAGYTRISEYIDFILRNTQN